MGSPVVQDERSTRRLQGERTAEPTTQSEHARLPTPPGAHAQIDRCQLLAWCPGLERGGVGKGGE